MKNPTAVTRGPWMMLVSRIVLFAAWQALIALAYRLSGHPNAWTASAAWWPVTATLTNVVCIFLLNYLYKQEGLHYWDIFRLERATLKPDLLTALGLALLGVVVASLPNIMLGAWLFGNAEATQALIFRPLPLWAIVPTLILFPVTIALAELPTYFAYVMPRLRPHIGDWASLLIPCLVLAFQHVTLPLVFDTPLHALAVVDVRALCHHGWHCAALAAAPADLYGHHSRLDGFLRGLDDTLRLTVVCRCLWIC